jgi:hypothetical protein
MVVLRALLFAYFASACYSPEIRDCTTACNQGADCAPGQVCGDDGFCASQDVAGRCASIAAPNDAGTDATDAPPDAPTIKLWVRVDGRGLVSIVGVGDCDGGSGQIECPFDVRQDAPLTLHATPKNNWRFDRWSDACDGQLTATCVIAPNTNTDVRARFELLDDAL